MSKFKIGDEIVAIKNHSLGRFKIGDEFIVDGFSCCPNCGKRTIYLKGINLIVNTNCYCECVMKSVRAQYAESSFEKKKSFGQSITEKIVEELEYENLIKL